MSLVTGHLSMNHVSPSRSIWQPEVEQRLLLVFQTSESFPCTIMMTTAKLETCSNDLSKSSTMVKNLEALREKNTEQIRSLQDSLRATETLKNDTALLLKMRESDLSFERSKLLKTSNVCVHRWQREVEHCCLSIGCSSATPSRLPGVVISTACPWRVRVAPCLRPRVPLRSDLHSVYC